eukprot:4016330-Alexandrium_andersonii.AAC.1
MPAPSPHDGRSSSPRGARWHDARPNPPLPSPRRVDHCMESRHRARGRCDHRVEKEWGIVWGG